MANQCLHKLQGFTAEQLANTLWGFATLGYIPGTPLLEAASGTMLKLLALFTPKLAADAMWGFARMEYRPPQALLDAVLKVCGGGGGFKRVEKGGRGVESERTGSVWFCTHSVHASTGSAECRAEGMWGGGLQNRKGQAKWGFVQMEYQQPHALLDAVLNIGGIEGSRGKLNVPREGRSGEQGVDSEQPMWGSVRMEYRPPQALSDAVLKVWGD